VKKKDVTTQVRFLDDVLPEGDASLVEQFWTSATNYLKTEFARISAASSFVKDSFVGEYPKLLRLFKEACTRISASTNVDALVSVHQNNSESSMLLRTVSQFEIEFLARSLERMFDPVRLVFPDRGRLPPSVDEVVNICKVCCCLPLCATGLDGQNNARLPAPGAAHRLALSGMLSVGPRTCLLCSVHDKLTLVCCPRLTHFMQTVATELSISNVDNGFAVKIARNVAKVGLFRASKFVQCLPGQGGRCSCAVRTLVSARCVVLSSCSNVLRHLCLLDHSTLRHQIGANDFDGP